MWTWRDRRPGPRTGRSGCRVRACGICGTDVHLADGEFSRARYPLVPGHEFAGEVVAIATTFLRSESGQGHGRPEQLLRPLPALSGGARQHVPQLPGLGITDPGACAEYCRSGVERPPPPDAFDMSVAALIEPLSCAVHGYDLLRTKLGDRFLIYGAGTMGSCDLLAGRVGAVSLPSSSQRGAPPDGPGLRRRGGRRERGRARRRRRLRRRDRRLGRRRGHRRRSRPGPAAAITSSSGWRRPRPKRFSPYHLFNNEMSLVGSMAVLHSFDRGLRLAVNVDLGCHAW